MDFNTAHASNLESDDRSEHAKIKTGFSFKRRYKAMQKQILRGKHRLLISELNEVASESELLKSLDE